MAITGYKIIEFFGKFTNRKYNFIILMKLIRTEASRCAHKCNLILNSVRQHNYFITQGNYIGYMFRLLSSHLQAYVVN